MAEEVTNAVLAEQLKSIKEDTGEIRTQQAVTNGRVYKHEGRIAALESKWGLFIKIALPLAGAGAGGTIAKLTGLF
ncbi:hypothetical protein LCGC14_2898180 [marine sediment metagenome]|uniref:Uncharacterized protein n=1 Tax=marine sediment metagenome TaxID=412755 RepID=A0A0F8XV80_9ZZZZ